MAAKSIDIWPPSEGFLVEPKFDGWRACLFCLSDGVYLQSRTGRNLGRYFPEVVAAARRLPVGCVIDGELVIWNGDRTDFALLQRRIATPQSPHPANLVGFDLLQNPTAGVLMHEPLTRRREFLEHLLDGTDARFAICPQSDSFDQADDWMLNWGAAGVEGVVVKRAAGRYRPGRRDWLKRRIRNTADVLIGGVIGSLAAPHALLVGELTGSGRLAYRGSTLPLTARQSRELGVLLTRTAVEIVAGPWPNPLPARWANLTGDRTVPYLSIEPVVTIEVDADLAHEHGRFRHAVRYVRTRLDLLP